MRFATGALVTLAARGFALVIGVATSVLTARLLGPEGRGVLALLMFFQGFAVTFGMMGMNGSITYFMAREPGDAPRIVQNAATLSVVAGGLVAALLWSASLLAPRFVLGTVDPRFLAIFLLSIPFTFLVQILWTVFLARQQFIEFNLLDLFVRSAQLAGFAVVLMILGGGTLSAVWVLVVVAVVSALLVIYRVYRTVPFRVGFDLQLFRTMVSYGGRVYASSVLMYLAVRVHIMMVNSLLGEGPTGIFSVAMQLVDVVSIVPITFGMILLPKSSAGEDPDGVLMLRVLRSTIVIMVVLCAGIGLFSDHVIALLFGREFGEAATVLQILLPGVVALSTTSIVNNHLAGRGLPMIVVTTPIVALAVMIPALMVVVSRFGLNGAAWVATAGYTLMAIILLTYTRRVLRVPWSSLLILRRADLPW